MAKDITAYFTRLTLIRAVKGVPTNFIHVVDAMGYQEWADRQEQVSRSQVLILRPMFTSRFREPESVSDASDVSERMDLVSNH
jgi:hypothetical protein